MIVSTLFSHRLRTLKRYVLFTAYVYRGRKCTERGLVVDGGGECAGENRKSVPENRDGLCELYRNGNMDIEPLFQCSSDSWRESFSHRKAKTKKESTEIISQIIHRGASVKSISKCVVIALGYGISRKANMLPFIPIIAIWCTLLIASPVHAEFRYAYPIVISAPSLACIVLLSVKKTEP